MDADGELGLDVEVDAYGVAGRGMVCGWDGFVSELISGGEVRLSTRKESALVC